MKVNKFYEHSQSEKFREYLDGKINLTPIMNILMNDYSNNWYSKIGEYFLKVMGQDFFKEEHDIILNRLKGSKEDKETSYRFLAIYFITSYLNEESLKRMFGNPIRHSYFGEGFDRKRKYTYCSYIVDIDGKTIHIGYDHRGTSIECESQLKPVEVFNVIKKLIDFFNNE